MLNELISDYRILYSDACNNNLKKKHMLKKGFNVLTNVLIIFVIGLFIARYFYMKPKFINGEKAPVFSATLIQDQSFELTELRGSYVLLDFWGSWCGPCRAESPALVALYQKYHGQLFQGADGFEIVSIGVERNEKSWQNAIRVLGLNWPYHILDLSSSMKFFNGEIAGQYGIKEVPTKFLLNPAGVIIGVNQSPAEIDKLLAKKLK